MNKFFKTVIAATALVSALGVSGCKTAGKEYTGDYHYDTEYGVYGVKVSVEVAGGIVKGVNILSSDYTEVTDIWDGKDNYLQHREALLKSFEGKTVEQVLAYTVSKDPDGAPVQVSADGIQLITGATLCSGRLILAIQDALSKA